MQPETLKPHTAFHKLHIHHKTPIHAIVDTLRSEFGSLTEKVNQGLQSIASVHSKQQFRNIMPQHQAPQIIVDTTDLNL